PQISWRNLRSLSGPRGFKQSEVLPDESSGIETWGRGDFKPRQGFRDQRKEKPATGRRQEEEWFSVLRIAFPPLSNLSRRDRVREFSTPAGADVVDHFGDFMIPQALREGGHAFHAAPGRKSEKDNVENVGGISAKKIVSGERGDTAHPADPKGMVTTGTVFQK